MVIDILLLLAAAFFLITSIIFNQSSAPNFFSHKIYIVETDAFSLVKKGSALIAEQAENEEIAAGNIIIFSDDLEEARIGEVQESKLEDGVYTFRIKNDVNEEITVGQSHILGKGIYYSEFIGGLVSFALSPLGVCFIAVLPCAAFVVFEVIASLRRSASQTEFETVKKQDETPTYIPPRQSYPSIDDKPAFSEGRERLMEAAGLFTPPQKKPQQRQEERAPISERDIDKLIKETRAKHLGEPMPERQSPEPRPQRPTQQRQAPRPAVINEEETRNMFENPIRESPYAAENTLPPDKRQENAQNTEPAFSSRRREETVKRYEPQKRNPPKLAPRVSRLDSLLQEETSDSHYDIDDILKSLENK